MSSRVVGHESQKRRLAAAWEADKLAHAYIFAGPSGVGKRTLAKQFAQALLCSEPIVQNLLACERCPSCRVFEAGNHPDFEEFEAAENVFEVETSRKIIRSFSKKPALGGRHVAVMDEAERFTGNAGNALLKLLEEPPPRVVLLLVTTTLEAMLPTIRSRCQSIAFAPVSVDEAAAVLQSTGLAKSAEEARFLAAESGGSVEGVEELRDDGWRALRPTIGARLSAPGVDAVVFAKDVNKWIEGAGKESAAKRRRAMLVIETAMNALESALKRGAEVSSGEQDVLCDMIQRTLTADEQVKRYLHLATVVDCWIDDLAQIAAGSYNSV